MEPQPPPRDEPPAPPAGPPTGPPPGQAAPGRAARWRRAVEETPASFALVALTVMVHAGLALVATGWPGADGAAPGWRGAVEPLPVDLLLRAGALERSLVWGGGWWRLLAAALLHGSWIHLGLNAVFGLGWCRLVERALGARRFLLLYAVAALVASSASLLAQDVVSVGASGALFGLIGATLALHRRALGGWGPFLRSRATRLVTVQLLFFTAVAVAGHLPLDHAAHGGGLVAGGLLAWLLTSPVRRPALRAAAGVAALALAVAACWPRPGLSRLAAERLDDRIYAALEGRDLPAAEALLAEAERGGLRGEVQTYQRGLLRWLQGQLDEAMALLRPLSRDGAPGIRPVARRALSVVAHDQGVRRLRGEGGPGDAAAALRWFEEACADGHQPSCREAERLHPPAP